MGAEHYTETKLRAASGARALAVRHVVVALMSLGGSVYLIRELGPEAWAAYSVGYYLVAFVDLNFGATFLGHLIRSPEPPTAREAAAGAWLAQAAGLAGAALVAAVSFPAAEWYGRSDLAYTLIAVAACGYVYIVRSVPSALLERRLDYRSIAIGDVVDQATFYLLAVPLVAAGAGLPGAAAALGLRGIVAAVYLRRRAPTPLLGRRHRAELRTLLSFGLPSLGMALAVLVNGLVPLVVLGGAHATELAFVLTTGTIMGYPVLFLAVVQRVGFPSLASLQADEARFVGGLQRLISVTNGVVVTLLAPMAATSPIWLPLLFGRRWEAAGVVAAVMSAGLLYASFGSILTSALNSLGHPHDGLVLWGATTVFYLGAALALVRVSTLVGVPIAFAASRALGGGIGVALLRRRGKRIRWFEDAVLLAAASGLMIGAAVAFEHERPELGALLSIVLAAGAVLARRNELELVVRSLRRVKE